MTSSRGLHGRAKERAAIDSLLERARAGRGGCLVQHGEPGIGKTTLLGYAAGMRVLRTVGSSRSPTLAGAGGPPTAPGPPPPMDDPRQDAPPRDRRRQR
ncbi:MAG: AAA family ATPase [Nitriliruptorales bacterium]|nr:AAA family ATPase [Nitriliruptorales bacterium]